MRKTAVFYGRVSDKNQVEQDVSIPSQIERGKKQAEELNCDLVRVFTDEGRTGTNDSRPEFKAAIEYCELYRPDYFIVWSSSRFARNRFDAAIYKRRLEKIGTKLVYIAMNVDRDTDSGMLLDGFLEIMDEHRSREISRDTKRSMMSNAAKGYFNGGVPPFGFEVIPAGDGSNRKRLSPHGVESVIVKDIFSMRASGNGSRMIAEHLNQQGILMRGRKWTYKQVLRLLKNEIVIGKIIFNRKDRKTNALRPREEWIIVDSHEPIIESNMWEQVQKMLAADAASAVGSARSNFVFSGMLQCGLCGSYMQIVSAKGRSRRYKYYLCVDAQNGRGCGCPRIPADKADEALLEFVCKNLFSRENVLPLISELKEVSSTWSIEHDTRRVKLQKDLEDVERRNKNLFGILELHGVDAPNLADLTRRIRTNNETTKAIETKLAALAAEVPPGIHITEDDVDDVVDTLRSMVMEIENPKMLRAFLGPIIQSISVKNDGVVEITYKPSALLSNHRTVHSRVKWLPEQDSNLRHMD